VHVGEALEYAYSVAESTNKNIFVVLKLMLVASNFMAQAGWSTAAVDDVFPEQLRSGQKAMIKHYLAASVQFCCVPQPPMNFTSVSRELHD
jgi:hypothetical protein